MENTSVLDPSAEKNLASSLHTSKTLTTPSLVFGLGVLLAWVAIAVFATWVAPHDPFATVGGARQPPSFEHWFGTDRLGRDVLSRVIFGARASLVLGFISVAIGSIVGTVLGLASGYYRGTIDAVTMRLVDAMLAFPGILLALVIIAALGPSITNAMIAVGVSSIPQYARLVRSTVLTIREEPYIEAARSLGIPELRILLWHVLPNAAVPLIVLSTLQFGSAISVGAGLSFLGLGAQPPTPEWGLMAAVGREFLGSSYLTPRPELYRTTFLSDFRAPDEGMKGKDILDMVIPAARARGVKVIPELMEPLFNYAGHGSADNVEIPNLPQVLEVDHLDRISSEPCLEHPAYRAWWHALIEDHCRNYEIDGIMWCNERRSPIDRLVSGLAPTCFCAHCIRAMQASDIDPDGARRACQQLHGFFGKAAAGVTPDDGALVAFLRVLLENPEILLLERHWVRRNKDLDRELYGITKGCNPELEFGLNVWNRNHFNPLRKAQWPWAEVKDYADWVKPIVYQHQAGQIYVKEMSALHRSVLRDFTPQEFTPIMYRILGLDEAPWNDLVASGLGPSSYVGGQCRDTIAALNGDLPVYMGIGVDAP